MKILVFKKPDRIKGCHFCFLQSGVYGVQHMVVGVSRRLQEFGGALSSAAFGSASPARLLICSGAPRSRPQDRRGAE